MKKILSAAIAVTTLLIPFTMMEVSAEESGSQIQVASVMANAGDDIDIPVEVINNEGIVAISFTVSYDTDALELISAEDCTLFADASFTPGGDVTAVPYRVMWEDALSTKNYTDTGAIVVFHFHVLDTAESGFSEVSINVEASNTFDVNMDDVAFEGINGGVEITGTETTTTTETTTATTTTTTAETTTTTTEETTTEPATTTTIEETTTTETTTTTEETTTETTTEETTTVEGTTTTAETTVSETTTTVKYFASEDELCNMASEDYKQKTGTPPAKAEVTTNADGTLSIVLTDESGKVLDTYVIDPVTGIGTSSNGNEVNLPQTGNNSLKTVTAATAALALTLFGSFAVAKSGVIRRKEDEQ